MATVPVKYIYVVFYLWLLKKKHNIKYIQIYKFNQYVKKPNIIKRNMTNLSKKKLTKPINF